jgi:hypothetical protein
MTQTLPLTIVLGSAYTGLVIGYRVLNLNRTSYSAFTTASVAETAVAGTYAVSGGVVAPNAGGYVIAGTALLDYAETVIEPTGGAGTGAGAIAFTYTLTSSVTGLPIADADVWVTSDLAGTNVLASGRTDAIGNVTLYLDAGTCYVWRQKSGWNFTNPDTEVVA